MARKNHNKGIHRQLLRSYILIIILMIIVGISSIYHVKQVYENGDTIYEDNLNAVDYLMNLDTNVRIIDQVVIRMVKHIGDTSIADNKAYIMSLRESNHRIMDEYESLNLSTMEKRRYKQCRLSIISFDKYIDTMIELIEEGHTVEANDVYVQELMPIEACTYDLLDAASELASKRAKSKNEDNKSFYTRTINIIAITMIFIVMLGLFISFRMSNSYTKKLKTIQDWADGIARYDISNDINIRSNDEFGATAKTLNDSQFLLRELLSKIKDEAETLSDSGEDIGEAVRKVKTRVEGINLTELHYDEDGKQLTALIKKTMQQYPLNEDMISEWNMVLERLQNNIGLANLSSKELMSIATYLEQIGVVADYQNKVIGKQKAHTDKFKV